MGETYDVRSDVEHLHENKHLEVFHRAARLDLVKKLEMMEYIARSPLARMRTRNSFASMCWMRLRRRGSGYRPSSTLGSKSRGRPNVIVE